MATMLDIVTRAFRKIGVGGLGEDITDEMAGEGIDALNGMLHEWKLRGVDLEYTDRELSDTFPLGGEFQDGTVHMLAMRLAPDYETPARFDADDFFRAVQAAYMTIATVALPNAVQYPPSRNARDGTLGWYD